MREMETTWGEKMSEAIRVWVVELNKYPGWKEWKRSHIGHTLNFDDPIISTAEPTQSEFKFSEEIEKQHAIIIQYLGLIETIESLKECEYYFRRFPFHGLPVTRTNHIKNICEMYFSRFYEFRERLKNYFNAIKEPCPDIQVDFGKIVKQFDKIFNRELRERHGVHPRARFQDLAIDQVYLMEFMATVHKEKGWQKERLIYYRRTTREWVERVRKSSAKLDEVLEAIAELTLTNCKFLSADCTQVNRV